MKIVIIGGTGHIGSFLVPRLVSDGHQVISVTRQERKPYFSHAAWDSIKHVGIDRVEAEKKQLFGTEIKNLNPDVVIDLICFKPESAKALMDALKGRISHLIHCGTIWVHGYSECVPTREDQPRHPFGEYGINKASIEALLLSRAKKSIFPATVLHPGHIVGPGWAPLNPAGHFNTDVFRKIARGDTLVLPNLGMETVHHVHADDVAQAFHKSLKNPGKTIGEAFHVVSEQALTLRGYAKSMSHFFKKKANLDFLPWQEWRMTVSETEAKITWDHISHSPNCSIQKAKRFFDYQPRYSSIEAVQESIQFLSSKPSQHDNL